MLKGSVKNAKSRLKLEAMNSNMFCKVREKFVYDFSLFYLLSRSKTTSSFQHHI